jgi:hypothetical protein
MSGTETFVCSKDFVRNIYFCLKICDPKASANWIASIVDAKDRRSNGPFFPDFLVRPLTTLLTFVTVHSAKILKYKVEKIRLLVVDFREPPPVKRM